MSIGTYRTTVSYSQDYTRVVFWTTEIVRFNSQEIVLNTGGWHTATTKRRMNQVSDSFGLGFHVYQEDFIWYVSVNGEVIPFEDGMTIERRQQWV